MWICLNDAFVSAVQSGRPGELKVRARRREHLETLFPGVPIVETRRADYRFRVFVDQEAFAQLVADKARSIDYTNFKSSVNDPALHNLYADFWILHADYQRSAPTPGVKGGDRSGHFAWGEEDVEFITKTETE